MFLAALGLAATPGLGWASDTYPSRPTRLQVPVGPGGQMDLLCRAFALELGKGLGQSVIVENRTGAAGQIAANVAARAVGDPYTLFVGSLGIMGISPHLHPNLPYDILRDFTPIALCATTPSAVVINPEVVPATNIAEFVTWARKQEHPIPYSSYGIGSVSHIAGLMFSQAASIRLSQVPYSGTSQIQTDLLKGDIPVVFDPPSSYMDFIKQGKLRVLATTSRHRTSLFPDVPTLDESGYPGFDFSNWYGLYGPRDMPPAALARLRQEMTKTLASETLRSQLAPMGVEIPLDGAETFPTFSPEQFERWGAFIRDNNIRLENV